MAEFNPDEYLKSTSTQTSAFNPDEYLKISQPKQPSFLDKAQRQLGLTGRYLIEGTVGTGDFLATPVRALQNADPGIYNDAVCSWKKLCGSGHSF